MPLPRSVSSIGISSVAGGQTASAIKEYEATKGKPPTGKPDRALLQQLRQEPERARQ